MGQSLDLGLVLLLLADVLHGGEQIIDAAIGLAHAFGVDHGGDDAAILAEEAALHDVTGTLAAEDTTEFPLVGFQFFRHGEIGAAPAFQLLAAVAGDGAQVVVELEQRLVRRDDGHADEGHVEELLQQPFRTGLVRQHQQALQSRLLTPEQKQGQADDDDEDERNAGHQQRHAPQRRQHLVAVDLGNDAPIGAGDRVVGRKHVMAQIIIAAHNAGHSACQRRCRRQSRLLHRQAQRQRRTLDMLQFAQIQHLVTVATHQHAFGRVADPGPGADQRIEKLLRRHAQQRQSDDVVRRLRAAHRCQPVDEDAAVIDPVKFGACHLPARQRRGRRRTHVRRDAGISSGSRQRA